MWFSFSLVAACGAAAETALVVKTPMAPPAWALLERELLRFNSQACERFAAKYVDERGYLLHTPRWGTLDGPDDAIETFFNWTLLHALGGSDSRAGALQEGAGGPLEAVRRAAHEAHRAGLERRLLQGVHHPVRLVPYRRGHAGVLLPGALANRTTRATASA